jgi:WD40 repeat protein
VHFYKNMEGNPLLRKIIITTIAFILAGCGFEAQTSKPFAPISTPIALSGTPIPESLAIISPMNANQIVQIARWGRGKAERVDFNPNGKEFVVQNSDGIYFYDARSFTELRFVRIENDYGLVFAPDGESFLSFEGWGDKVNLRQTSDGKLIRTIVSGSQEGIIFDSVAFSPGGKTLALGGGNGRVQIRKVEDGSLIETVEHPCSVEQVAFSSDGQILVSMCQNESVRLWRVDDGALLQSFQGESVNEFEVSPDGNLMAYSTMEKLYLVNIKDGKAIHQLQLKYGADELAFTPDGLILASGSVDGVRLWQVKDGALLQTLEHDTIVDSLTFTPDGRVLISVSNGIIHFWNVEDGAHIKTFGGFVGSVSDAVFSPDGKILASGSNDGTLSLWQVNMGSLERTIEGHAEWVTSVDFSSDGKMLASASGDGAVRLWRVDDGSLIDTFPPGVPKFGFTNSFVMDVEFSPDDAQVASAITNNVFLWKTGNENPIIKLRHKEYVDSIAFSPDGRLIATGSRDSHVYLWNVQDGQLSSTLAGHADMVESVAFSPDGQRLASGSVDGAVCIWRVQDGALEKTLRERKEGVNSTSVYGLAFSPDGLLLAVVGGGHDGTIRLWNVKDGKLLAVIRGHQDGVYSVSFSNDGTLLATASVDGTVRLWGIVQP